jgi:hypothetical protein
MSSRSYTKEVYVDVDIDLDDFDDDELIDELERRKVSVPPRIVVEQLTRDEAQYLRELLDAARLVSPKYPPGVSLFDLDSKLSALS